MTISYHRNDKEEFSDRLTDLVFKCVNAPEGIVNYLHDLLKSAFEIIKVAESQHHTISGYKFSLEQRDEIIADLKAILAEDNPIDAIAGLSEQINRSERLIKELNENTLQLKRIIADRAEEENNASD